MHGRSQWLPSYFATQVLLHLHCFNTSDCMQLPSSMLASQQFKGGWVQFFSFASPNNFLTETPVSSPLFGGRLNKVVPMSKHRVLEASMRRGIKPKTICLGTKWSEWPTSSDGCFTPGTHWRAGRVSRVSVRWLREESLPLLGIKPGSQPRSQLPRYVLLVVVR
jgi:hypothetical protein